MARLMSDSMTIRCATTNQGKLREFRLAGAAAGFEVETLDGLREIPAPEETGHTFEENAVQKALYYGARTPDWFFTDDSGLEVDALDGAPGVHSARYAGEDATDADNNNLLLERLRGCEDRGAQFVCAIALARAGRLVKTFRGVVRGRIIGRPRGSGGFGYDPLFFHEPFGCTFGEADLKEKMQVSHRAQALRQMFSWLRDNASTSGIR
jgi:XTP/dITP diphosphohydrolase